MKKLISLYLVLLCLSSCVEHNDEVRILVFSKTSGFYHESIPTGVAALQELGKSKQIRIDTTTNAEYFTEDSLKNYSAVVFLSTTGDVLNHYQEAEFERYIQAGGGYVGIHAASDTEHNWDWYGKLVGGYFSDHPGIRDRNPNVQPGDLHITEKHIATEMLPEVWQRTDEWYSFRKMYDQINVIMKIDEDSYKGGEDMGDHPMSWYHEYDGGRAFYTALGHTKESFSEPLFIEHIWGGIQYAVGENKKLNYKKAKSLRVPEEERFIKTTLVGGEFYEPTELTVLPNLDILVTQRRGEILLHKAGTNSIQQVGYLKVYYQSSRPGVNAEEGILGIQADPNFAKNNYVYIFYSPADTALNRLSRFVFKNDSIHHASEKIVLEFYSQRDICCHTGGSIAFDKDGLLYVSTGDNTTPFNEPGQKYVTAGFAPLDDRPGHEQFDGRRSAGNSNDLRGKILRIRVNEDGSYSIPKGNLYPEGTPNTRPEIYIQGTRNPYRISVDQKNGYLYWGDVGNDANNDSLQTRGPRGYDEINQARQAGHFGWPYFVGDNFAYFEYDYETGTTGAKFDPAKPINNSRNNTGIKELPPAQPAFIYYPYARSFQFPDVGTGGRNAMAGPVYYPDLYPKQTRYPEYFNGKFIAYDWTRGWIKLVTMNEKGDFLKMEPFMQNTKLNALIDMEVGPDGRLYFLEYGNGWFRKNEDSGLSRIDYVAGNVAPQIKKFEVSKTSGALPLTVTFTVEAHDLERKPLKFRWILGDGTEKETTTPTLEYTYTKPAVVQPTVEVIDDNQAKTVSQPLKIYAGNAIPSVEIVLKGNKSFYFPSKQVQYEIIIKDEDDPNAATNKDGLFVSANYLDSRDRAGSNAGHQQVSEIVMGKNLIQSSTCKTCHDDVKRSIGPSFLEIAQHYKHDAKSIQHLVSKIIKGGNGVWGEANMPANPSLKESEAQQIVSYIFSLNQDKSASLPMKGSINATLNQPATLTGRLLIQANYTDNGGEINHPLTVFDEVSLQNPSLRLFGVGDMMGFNRFFKDGEVLLNVPPRFGSFNVGEFDLDYLQKLNLEVIVNKALQADYTYSLHIDSPMGEKISEVVLSKGTKLGNKTLSFALPQTLRNKPVKLYLMSRTGEQNGFDTVYFRSLTFQ
jgi:cytochrome c